MKQTKQYIVLLLMLLLNNSVMAQLPANSFFEFEFTGGSLNNTSTSGAPNFTGTITSIDDRNGSVNDAADITGLLGGANVGAANVNEMTLSFWMRHDPMTSNERILQIYGTNGNGFRMQMDGTQLLYNGKAGNSASPSNTESELVNIDDSNWHHIVIRTTLRATADTLEFDVFLDNVLQTSLSDSTINVSGVITNFLESATLIVSPTGNYSGDIDDIYFYKSALTDTEISQIYFNNNSNCIVNIPDANFKAYLVGNAAINTNGDTEIQCSEADAFTDPMYATAMGIADLTGIEAFTGINILHITSNLLTSVDLSQNTALSILKCAQNQLSTLDLSTHPLLYNLDVTQNLLTTIDLTANSGLSELNLTLNQISSIDLSNLVDLTILKIADNNLTDLTLTSNVALEELICKGNQIVSLDVSGLPVFAKMRCDDNSLTSLNLANGNNSNYGYMIAGTNSGLSCIQVDDVAYSTTNWTSIDAVSNFSTNCTVLVSSITVQGQGGVSSITTQGGILQMEANVLPTNADDGSYTWVVTNGTGSASINSSGLLTAFTDGTVTVWASANDASGLSGTATVTISNQSLSVNEFDFQSITIYPNPVQNELFFELDNLEFTEMTILDYSGRVVKSITNNTVNSIDVSDLKQGVYILKVYAQNSVSNTRFVKQ
jgi:hypothetical protein